VTARNLRAARQELLLQAAILPSAAAFGAWEQWRSITDLDDAPPGSYRLMPLIHRNLEPLRTEYSDIGRLTGIRRKNFVQNRLLFRAAGDVLRSLREAGIETMLLRGAALAAGYYCDAGVRSMRNADILVTESKAVDAASLLRSRGWREVNPTLSLGAAGFRRHHTSIAFQCSSGVELRLHWHVLPWRRAGKADEWFWSASARTEFYGAETRTLSPSDQLLYSCLASLQWGYEPSFWRVADVLTILNACGAIKADRLLPLASDQHLEYLLYRALGRLRDDFDARVPEELLDSLAGLAVTRNDRYEFEYVTEPYLSRSVPAWLVGTYRQHRRSGQSTLAGHLWRSLRWTIVPGSLARIALSKHRNRVQPLPADAEEPAHPRRRAVHRPTVLPG
jgi:hypothetical protein